MLRSLTSHLNQAALCPATDAPAAAAPGVAGEVPATIGLCAVELDGISPQIDATAWVAPNSVLVGGIHMMANSSVWFGCTLRADNTSITIGEGSNVQENSVLHCDDKFPLSIGSGCTIGHMVMLHGCKIADKCLVGMGAVILNGASIGAGSIIGAGSLIPEGKQIPPNSLVLGSPGKITRQTNERDRAMIQHGVNFYQQNARRFRTQLGEQGLNGMHVSNRRYIKSRDVDEVAAFGLALKQDSVEEALELIKAKAPRAYLIHGHAIEGNLRRHFRV